MNFFVELTGKRLELALALDKNQDVPAGAKKFIADGLAALPPGPNGAKLTAYCQTIGGVLNLHLTLAQVDLA